MALFGVLGLLRKEYVGPIRKSTPNVPQLRSIVNFWASLKRKGNSKNFCPKDVMCLMAKIRKELKAIEFTGIREAMKEVTEKA
jgi:hypothetical protein